MSAPEDLMKSIEQQLGEPYSIQESWGEFLVLHGGSYHCGVVATPLSITIDVEIHFDMDGGEPPPEAAQAVAIDMMENAVQADWGALGFEFDDTGELSEGWVAGKPEKAVYSWKSTGNRKFDDIDSLIEAIRSIDEWGPQYHLDQWHPIP